MPRARLARAEDLASLLELYPHANPKMPVLTDDTAQRIWTSIAAHPGTSIFVSEAQATIVATCMLITAPNLMRGGRGHAFIENVVTHADFRRQGHGHAVIHAALDAAWEQDCFHVLLQSGRPDPGVHRFYEECGFVPGVRTGYVARRPDSS